MNPLWFAVHGLVRPTRPTVDDLLVVMRDLGINAGVERWMLPLMEDEPVEEIVPHVRQALCLPAERDPEVAAALAENPPPPAREISTLWWDP
jgi:hypothetical protein